MPASLTVDHYLRALATAGGRLVDSAEQAGLDTAVPTCPGWGARALLAHQAMVHRFAAANVLPGDPDDYPNQTTILAEVADLPAFYREGHAALIAALRDAPVDLEALTFLNDAPPPREFWARRQAHETTIHMADAVAARVGRLPASETVDVPSPIAVDGIDELLRGFFTRGRSKLFEGTEYAVLVAPTDSERRWYVRIAEHLTVAPGDDDGDGDADATISGTAAALYLGLWNRGDEIEVEGDPDILSRWRQAERIRWG